MGRDDIWDLHTVGQSLVGRIKVVNSGPPCVLSGRPMVRIVGPAGPLRLKYTTVSPVGSMYGRQGIGLDNYAVLAIRWSNWCGGSLSLSSFRVEVATHRGYGAIPVRSSAGGKPPVCGAPKYPSILGVSLWSFAGKFGLNDW